jgi:hypothetical protein
MPDPADQAWLFAKLVPQSLATTPNRSGSGTRRTDPAREPGGRSTPSRLHLLHGRQGDVAVDRTVRTATPIRPAPGWQYRELADTHLAPINGPQATAEALLSLV